jgi:predicted transcriptional regulator
MSDPIVFPNMANTAVIENELLQAALDWLRDRAPADWTFTASTRPELMAEAGRVDLAIEIGAPGVGATLAVEAKRSLEPRAVGSLFGSVGRTIRKLSPNIPVLVVAPWLSARTRELLASEGLNYLDLTGNARVHLDRPALFIETQGADRDPSPAPRGQARLRGPKAGRLIRFLVDVRPPYGVRELAQATGLAPGYVSRLLNVLEQEALIDRSKNGSVESAEAAGLLRRWTQNYDVFKNNGSSAFLAARGAAEAMRGLAELEQGTLTAVTGSFAAVRIAPVAAPTLLAVYCEELEPIARALDLVPADQGANVVLLRPFDSVVWERTSWENDMRYVAASQTAADCLTGNGRMPAEGEAMLNWMQLNEAEWRLGSIDELYEPGPGDA